MWKLSESKSSCRARGHLFAEIDCVVAKNNEAVEAAEGLAEPPLCINTASRVPRRLFESLGSSDCLIPVEARYLRYISRYFSAELFFL